MNIFVRNIGRDKLPPKPEITSNKLVVEDNIGESIHIHIRNTRIDLSIEDYLEFADCIEEAERRMKDGSC